MSHTIFIDSIGQKDHQGQKGIIVISSDEYRVSDHVREWMIGQVPDSDLSGITWYSRTRPCGLVTDFFFVVDDPDLALLIKLTWGGHG